MFGQFATALAAVCFWLCCTAPGLAEDEPKKKEADPTPAKQPEKKSDTGELTGKAAADALFKQLDKNGDGTIAGEEVEGERQQRFFQRLVRTGDKNGDKMLTREEFERGLSEPLPSDRPDAARPAVPEGRVDPIRSMDRFDKNGDGKITAEELPAGANGEYYKQIIDRFDLNQDGALDRDEIATARAAAGVGGVPRPGALFGVARVPVGPGLMRILDADGDGTLSSDEIAKAAEALKKLDKNGDGKVTADELPAAPAGEGGRIGGGAAAEPFARRLAEFDKDGDGKISKDEAPARIKALFDRLDRNGDGFIDREEFRLQADAGARPAGETPRRRPE